MKQFKDLIDINYAQEIVDNILNKVWTPSKEEYDKNWPEHEVKYKMEDRYLKSLQLREIKENKSHNFAKDADDRNVNRNSYS